MPPTLEGQITMEKTPSYWVTRTAPRRVYEMNPSVKLLAVVRDPVTRAISDYTQSARYMSYFFKILPSFHSHPKVGNDHGLDGRFELITNQCEPNASEYLQVKFGDMPFCISCMPTLLGKKAPNIMVKI